MQAALEQKDFETALGHALQAAPLVEQSETEARSKIAEAMLQEVRAGFASSRGTDVDAVLHMILRTVQVQPRCREASFWQALCHLREGRSELAMVALEAARGDNDHIDPPLYLGALLFRQGQGREAIRYLAEANRIDGNCPFVVCQLGMAMLQGGGDPAMAVRALQKALGARGFEQWSRDPQRAWIEGFPHDRSYVRKLAEKHPFICPLWGADFQTLKRQSSIALGQGHYRLGQFRESSQVFDKLLQEGAPSLPVLRGLGLALARQGEYDQAFKHLRMAHDMEEPRDRVTAGYLALCGARGKPLRQEDKIKNVTWAIRLVSQFTAPADPEWANLVSDIFAEARALHMPLDRDDQLYVCEHLASVNATDAQAAEAFHFLMGTNPEVVRDEYAWLYVRAAQVHELSGPYALALFARAFADRDRAREFFAQHGWDLEAVELAYLERAAAMEPGDFPAVLGPDYAARGQTLLLERSRSLEEAGALDAALASAEVFWKLAPGNPQAHDLLASLHYRRGDRSRAIERLRQWHELRPQDAVPLLRLAIIAHEQGDTAGWLEFIRAARDRTQGPQRARIAFLGARLALKDKSIADDEVFTLLEDCLVNDPGHVQARWCLAALYAERGDEKALAGLAPLMDRPEVDDARFHFMAAVCQLASGNFAAARETSRRAFASSLCEKPASAEGLPWEGESQYLAGWASLLLEDLETAYQAFQVSARDSQCSGAGQAMAMLGKISFARRDHEGAARWWRALEPENRGKWNLSGALAGAVFLAALDALHEGSYEAAAEKFREAGRLGWRDRRLGPLLILALAKAGQHFLYGQCAS